MNGLNLISLSAAHPQREELEEIQELQTQLTLRAFASMQE